MLPVAGNDPHDPDLAIRTALSKAMARGGRKEIAAKLSSRIGRPITVSQLDDYTRTTRAAARFPASYVRAFCDATDSDELLRLLFTTEIQSLVKLGECEREMQRQQRTKRSVVEDLLTDGKMGGSERI